MSVRKKILRLLPCLFVLFFACKSQQNTITKTKVEEFTVEKLEFQYLSAKAKATYQANDQSTKVTADFRIHKGESIWVSLRSTGIEGLRLLITPESIKGINRLEKVYYNYSYEDLKKEFDLELNYEIIESILLGELPASVKMKNKALLEGDNFVLRNNKGEYKSRAYVSNSILKLSKLFLEAKERKGNDLLVLFTNFQDLSEGKEQYLPYQVQIMTGESDAEEILSPKMLITLDYSRIELSNTGLKMPFSIPSKYEEKKF